MNIPAELERFRVYTNDGGHEFQCIPECDTVSFPDHDKEEMICTIPVKAVLKAGYKISEDGYLIAFIKRDEYGSLLYDNDDFTY